MLRLQKSCNFFKVKAKKDLIGSRNGFGSSSRTVKLQACVFCEFVQTDINVCDLSMEDESLYLRHLRVEHGLEK